VTGYLRAGVNARDAETVMRWLYATAERGYALGVGYDDTHDAMSPGISMRLRASVDDYAAGKERFFSADGWWVGYEGLRGGFEFSLGTSPEDAMILVEMSSYQINGWLKEPGERWEGDEEHGRACFDVYLDMVRLTYDIWRPL
jgi:hypothetical protein